MTANQFSGSTSRDPLTIPGWIWIQRFHYGLRITSCIPTRSNTVIAFAYFFEPSVAEDPSGATGCTTQWNKQPELVILLV